MSYPRHPSHLRGDDASAAKPTTTWTVRRKPSVPQPSLPTRRYEVTWIDDRGVIQGFTRAAPAVAIFEEAFGAFARGTLIATACGPVAVEDLHPGMMIETTDGDHKPLRWIGAMTLIPNAQRADGEREVLFRVSADAFGFGRPALDLMMGPHARYLMRSDSLRSYLGAQQALAPVAGVADGMSVIEVTPMSPVPCFHIALDQHQLIRANGITVESYHPGANTASRLMGDLRAQFLGLFPHIHEMADFGTMCQPRLSVGDLAQMNAA